MRFIYTVVLLFSALLLPMQAQAESASLGCILEPSKKIDISSSVAGVIDNIPVSRGQKVRKGQLLFSLRSGVHQAAVKLAEAKADFAERKMQRNSDLYADDLLSDHERDQVETESLIAQLELNQAKAELALRKTYSPVTGVVVEKHNNEGEYVAADPVLELAVLQPLYAEVLMSVERFGALKVGERLTVELQGPVSGTHDAKIAIVDPIVDSASGTFRVRLELPNPTLSLPAGVPCVVKD